MIEVFCPNCNEFIELKTDKLHSFEMEGDTQILKDCCPKCKEIAEVKITLHWQGL